MHTEPIPRMGGLAIVMGFLVALGIAALFMTDMRTGQLLGFIGGLVIIVIAGMLDDIFTLSPKAKAAVQIIAAILAVSSGIRITFVHYPFEAVFDWLSYPITLVWIVGITNAVNIIDGLDGLAAGVSAIAAVCLFILCFLSGSVTAVALSAALAGSCLGFIPRNLNPAEVIMGDTGAQFLGYVLAVSSILGVFKGYAILSVFIACFALALPIFDTAFAMVRRMANKKSISEADRGHLHHRLVDAGYSQRQAVAILYAISAISAIISIVIAMRDARAILVAAICLLIMFLMMYVYRKRLR
jgi:UDP-GlcNAc:undecaprenyl-phosphate GlcNAc-1-phosphate transferase